MKHGNKVYVNYYFFSYSRGYNIFITHDYFLPKIRLNGNLYKMYIIINSIKQGHYFIDCITRASFVAVFILSTKWSTT